MTALVRVCVWCLEAWDRHRDRRMCARVDAEWRAADRRVKAYLADHFKAEKKD